MTYTNNTEFHGHSILSSWYRVGAAGRLNPFHGACQQREATETVTRHKVSQNIFQYYSGRPFLLQHLSFHLQKTFSPRFSAAPTFHSVQQKGEHLGACYGFLSLRAGHVCSNLQTADNGLQVTVCQVRKVGTHLILATPLRYYSAFKHRYLGQGRGDIGTRVHWLWII